MNTPAWQGKCEAQRQVGDYQVGIPMTGSKATNPYPRASRDWFEYEVAFSDFINMAFERS